MNIYKPIIIVGILVALVTVGLAIYEQLTAATRDKNLNVIPDTLN